MPLIKMESLFFLYAEDKWQFPSLLSAAALSLETRSQRQCRKEQPRIHPHHSVLLWQCSMQCSMILLEGVLLVDGDITYFT